MWNASKTTVLDYVGTLADSATSGDEALCYGRRQSSILPLKPPSALWQHRIELRLKSVKKVKLQMKAHFLHPMDLISIIRFLATFKLAYKSKNIHEYTLLRVLAHYVTDSFADAQNSCMCAENRFALLAAS